MELDLDAGYGYGFEDLDLGTWIQGGHKLGREIDIIMIL